MFRLDVSLNLSIRPRPIVGKLGGTRRYKAATVGFLLGVPVVLGGCKTYGVLRATCWVRPEVVIQFAVGIKGKVTVPAFRVVLVAS